ncbi:hypothetical protein HAX54_012842, partial [Datura stramonium]|nr:hypothetical protein [Datura stramonium]
SLSPTILRTFTCEPAAFMNQEGDFFFINVLIMEVVSKFVGSSTGGKLIVSPRPQHIKIMRISGISSSACVEEIEERNEEAARSGGCSLFYLPEQSEVTSRMRGRKELC